MTCELFRRKRSTLKQIKKSEKKKRTTFVKKRFPQNPNEGSMNFSVKKNTSFFFSEQNYNFGRKTRFSDLNEWVTCELFRGKIKDVIFGCRIGKCIIFEEI